MNKEKAIAIASKLFPKYSGVQKYYITSDGQAFDNEAHAGNHARSFKKEKDQEVIPVSRSECKLEKESK